MCGLPFLVQTLGAADQDRCADCREGRLPDNLPEPPIVEATEHEIRTAVAETWRFMSSPGLTAYLNRLAARVARHVNETPSRPRVVLIDNPSITTLALPSGLVLMSVGTLDGLEDEAELAFVLGHELVHAVSGEAARRLVRLGLGGVTRNAGAPSDQVWLGAVRDMITLGYGCPREREADARSLEAFLALGYDPNSILRYLERLEARITIADPAVCELALAHPTPAERMRQVTKALHGRTESGPVKVNREVFRRAAGHTVLTSELDPVTLEEADAEGQSKPTNGRWRLLWTGVGILVVAALILLMGILLSG